MTGRIAADLVSQADTNPYERFYSDACVFLYRKYRRDNCGRITGGDDILFHQDPPRYQLYFRQGEKGSRSYQRRFVRAA